MEKMINEYTEESKYAIWYSSVEISNIKKLRLIKSLYSLNSSKCISIFKEIFNAPDLLLIEKGGFNLEELLKFKDEKRKFNTDILKECEKENIHVIPINSLLYPPLLKIIPDPPIVLYVKGNIKELKNMLERPSVSIVGARMCTSYGISIAEELAEILSSYSINIISGMANGIDTASHRGALKGKGFTAAILGCGANVCYPNRNRKIYNEIIEKGLIISEYPPKTPPIAFHFPRRNRIIAGLSQSLIVVEAKLKSGSLITAKLAEEYGRDIYAVPGRITDNLSTGTNKIINEGAVLIESTDSLIKSLNLYKKDKKSSSFDSQTDFMSKEELTIFNEIDYYATHIDSIFSKCNLSENDFYKNIQSLIDKHKINEIFPDYFIKV